MTDMKGQLIAVGDKIICRVPGSWCDGKQGTVGALHAQGARREWLPDRRRWAWMHDF